MAQKFNSQDSERAFNHYRKRVARLNAYINDVIKQVGSNEVYLDKSSIIIAPPASVWPIEEVPTEKPGFEIQFNQRYVWPELSADGITKKCDVAVIRITWEYDLEADEWYAEYHGDSFSFDEDLRYRKKCVRAGLRYWQSEDPDRFLEKDDDEEGGEA